MTKPPGRRPRRSFGGKDGVWWRKKTLPPLTLSTSSGGTSSPASTNTNEEDDKSNNTMQIDVEWDDDLCRPIYHKNVVSDGFHDDDSSDDEVSSELVVEDKEGANPVPNVGEDQIVPVKRKKAYGGKGPRPLSLLLLESNLEYSSSSPSSSPDKKKSRPETASPLSLVPLPSSESSPSQISLVTALNVLPRRVSTSPGGLMEEVNQKTTKDGFLQTPSNTTPGSPKESLFNFVGSEVKGRSREVCASVNANSSVQKAQEYFRNLDATERLHLDSSDSPVVSSKVTRSSRKVNLQSPGIVREYTDYSKSISATGISPLSVKEYAQSRRDFFRKGQLFEGFLDD